MGREIGASRFTREDFDHFARRLAGETALLKEWFRAGAFSASGGIAGFELEAWLLDRRGQPAPINEEYLVLLGDEALYSPELSRFNVEINSTPRAVSGDGLRRMHAELERNWGHCVAVAGRLDATLAMIGILPTLHESMLTLEQMSNMARYRALNEQVLRLREGRPLQLDIEGVQRLRTEHRDVMLEAATTSFQIHLQVAADEAVAYYNTLQLISAPMVAITANSPLLFGHRLWSETRIPLFEQAVAVGGIAGAAFGPLRRVSFGSGFARQSLFEPFEENADHFPILLPAPLSEEPARMEHLRLHNGTIWRWNRPLIGFEPDGTPHLRLEHRVIPAGPSVVDTIANLALLFGLARALRDEGAELGQRIEFARVRDNFYRAARHGLEARLDWFDGSHLPLVELWRQLLPLAERGLELLDCDRADIDDYLGVIAARLASGTTGAVWQLKTLERLGGDLDALVATYLEQQQSGRPVHEWPNGTG